MKQVWPALDYGVSADSNLWSSRYTTLAGTLHVRNILAVSTKADKIFVPTRKTTRCGNVVTARMNNVKVAHALLRGEELRIGVEKGR